MTNEEFQKVVLEKLSTIENTVEDVRTRQDKMETRLDNIEISQDKIILRLDDIETSQDKVDEKLYKLEVRQNEIYDVVKAIEHSNQVGRAELDRHDFSIAEVKGILKKAGKIMVEELDEASNL